MPPLDEGSLLYMPTTLPGISVAEAQRLLSSRIDILKQFPEVSRVFGKAGRAETSTDPAPFSMMETVIVLKPQTEWRKTATWYSTTGRRSGIKPGSAPHHADTSPDRATGDRDERSACSSPA